MASAIHIRPLEGHLEAFRTSDGIAVNDSLFHLRKVRVKIPIVMKKRYLLAGVSGVVAGAVAAKLLTRPRDVSWPDSINLIYHPEHSWFTTVDGVRIHYQEAGDENAPPMILIHGFISSNLVWNEVFLPLAKSRLSRHRAGPARLWLFRQAPRRRVHHRRPGARRAGFDGSTGD